MSSKSSVPTGMKNLDSILSGGLPKDSNLLIFGEPLCGKKPLLMEFIYQGLKKEIPGIFILTDYGFSEWKKMMDGSGWKIDKYEGNGLLQIIDCYSKQFDPSLEDEGIVAYVESPSDLSAISLQVSTLQEEMVKITDNHRLGFHSISSLLESNSSESVYKFMQFLTGKCRRAGATSMYTMEKGMHSEKDVVMVEHLMDGVIEFSEDKLRVKGLSVKSPAAWHKYEIGKEGVEIKL